MNNVAALFVETGGAYYGLPFVDPWDIERDARLYGGPDSVVAHPPCLRWSVANVSNEAKYGPEFAMGNDAGCFGSALESVRKWGGVLEHPAYSYAFRLEWFNLGKPLPGSWQKCADGIGWVTQVSQVAYGHPARKRTWLYYVGSVAPADLDWSEPAATACVGGAYARVQRAGPRLSKKQANATPIAFQTVLLDLARNANMRAKDTI